MDKQKSPPPTPLEQFRARQQSLKGKLKSKTGEEELVWNTVTCSVYLGGEKWFLECCYHYIEIYAKKDFLVQLRN